MLQPFINIYLQDLSVIIMIRRWWINSSTSSI